MRYLVVISYDGTLFHGFQRQKDVKNVQSILESTLSNYLNEDIVIKGSGRTDAGVHALGQTFHFDTTKTLNKNFIKDINKLLKDEIVIKSIKKVDNNFHARHSVKKKIYCYKINMGKYNKDYEGYVLQPKAKIDINKIKKVAKEFIGEYDFHNFVGGIRDNYYTTIYKIKIKKHKDILEIYFYGKAFYRYMIRKLVGAMLDYNKGRVTLEEIRKMLNDSNYNKQLSTVKADGLYLIKVCY